MDKKLFIFRLTALLLAAALSLALISCGGDKTSPGGESDSGATEAVAETTDPYSDDLPEGLDFDGTEIRFLSAVEKTCIAIGEDDDLGDIVNAALWQRNLDLENRLNVKMVLVRTTGFGDFNKAATESIAAGSDDYEVLCGHTRFNTSVAAEKMLLNLNDVEYLDFTKPYWSELYTSNVNYKDNYYWAAGDITTSFIRYIYAVFVNSAPGRIITPESTFTRKSRRADGRLTSSPNTPPARTPTLTATAKPTTRTPGELSCRKATC